MRHEKITLSFHNSKTKSGLQISMFNVILYELFIMYIFVYDHNEIFLI